MIVRRFFFPLRIISRFKKALKLDGRTERKSYENHKQLEETRERQSVRVAPRVVSKAKNRVSQSHDRIATKYMS